MAQPKLDYIHYANRLEIINERSGHDPAAFVAQTEQRYHDAVEEAAQQILASTDRCGIVMLAGPSSSGKTTTAHLLADAVKRKGIPAVIVSLDDFYLGERNAPMLKNGQHDYESLQAIDVPRLQSCLLDLMTKRVCEMPVFNFEVHQPHPYTRHVVLREHEVVVVEGLHALNPVISENLPKDRLLKVYISVKQGIDDGEEELLSPKDIRLIRRVVRDYNFRGSMPERTLSMWGNVLDGERKYINPYRPGADLIINSFHAYELGVLAPVAIPLLQAVPDGSPFFSWCKPLLKALERFLPIRTELVPQTSILREFIGGGKYH